MVFWKRLVAVGVGTGAGFYAYYYQKLRDQKNTAIASWTNSETPVNACAVWDCNWDCRAPKSVVRPMRNNSPEEQNRYNSEIEAKKPKAVRHLVLIRHGQYSEFGDGDEMHKLTDLGRMQAKYTGKRLNELGIKWDKVYVSTMTRAKETADIVLKEIDYDAEKVHHCMLLREGAPIAPQPPVGHWRPEQSQFFRDGARIEAGFRRYFHRALPEDKSDQYLLFIAHANVIRYFVCRALQLPPEAWLRISLNHASITWLQIQPNGNVQIRCMGESGFMPPDTISSRIPCPDAKNVV